MTRLAAFLAILVTLLGASPALANHMSVSLVPESRSVLPGGTATLALTMRPEAGWHGYWRNPGDAGTEPRIQWRLDDEWRAAVIELDARQ